MKKTVLVLMCVAITTLYSCRENTQEKTEEAVEAFGKDIENNVNKATDKVKEGAEKVEDGAKKVGKEIDEEIEKIDDKSDH